MGNIVGLDLNIDNNYLEQAVKQTVVMGISEALNGKNEIVSQVVNSVLSVRVTEQGTVSTYERDNRYTLLEYYVYKALKEETRGMLKALVEEKRPEIRKIIQSDLAKKSTAEKFSDCFIDTVCKSLSASWKTKIDINLERDDD